MGTGDTQPGLEKLGRMTRMEDRRNRRRTVWTAKTGGTVHGIRGIHRKPQAQGSHSPHCCDQVLSSADLEPGAGRKGAALSVDLVEYLDRAAAGGFPADQVRGIVVEQNVALRDPVDRVGLVRAAQREKPVGVIYRGKVLVEPGVLSSVASSFLCGRTDERMYTSLSPDSIRHFTASSMACLGARLLKYPSVSISSSVAPALYSQSTPSMSTNTLFLAIFLTSRSPSGSSASIG